MKTVEQIVEEVASRTTGGLAVPLTNAVKQWMTHAVNAYIEEQEASASHIFVQYGHMFPEIGWMPEYKGRDYATHQRTVIAGPINLISDSLAPQKTVRDVIEEQGGTTPSVQGWA